MAVPRVESMISEGSLMVTEAGQLVSRIKSLMGWKGRGSWVVGRIPSSGSCAFFPGWWIQALGVGVWMLVFILGITLRHRVQCGLTVEDTGASGGSNDQATLPHGSAECRKREIRVWDPLGLSVRVA